MRSVLLALSVGDLLLIYAIPIALFIAAWLVVSLVVWLLVRSRLDFAFKHDLLAKFEAKLILPSGRRRLSYFYVARLLLGDNCIQAAFLYRISHWLVRHRMRALAELVYAVSKLFTHTDVSPWANIGPGLYLYHGLGTVIGKGSTIGRRALICHGVSIGGGATLGEDVKVWAHAQIMAKVTIGDRTEVSANSVVMQDFPPDSILFGMPARLAGKTSSAPAEPAPSAV
jgi:serine O-acetyltransferase